MAAARNPVNRRAVPGTHGEKRTTMKGILKCYDAAFITAMVVVRIFARQFQRRLVGLCTGVAKEDAIGKGGVD